MNIYIETYGCTANLNNSEIFAGMLTQSKNNIVKNLEIADILILNTCVVKSKTENKIKRRISDLITKYNDKLIIIAGCMPETNFKFLHALNSKLIFLGTNHIKDINNLILNWKLNKLSIEKQKDFLSRDREEKILLPKIPENKLISITQISEGCLGNCSYCKTRLAKGKLYSYAIEKIVKSIESDLRNGAKEVWITSQDNGIYGLDWKESKRRPQLVNLLKKILNLPYKFKLRLGMMNPNAVYFILDELIEIYKNPKMYKFIHIPIQSASNKVLKDMNRNYKIEKVVEIINKFRKEFPDLVFATDIISGYPSENNDDANLNLKFIEKFMPDVFNLSRMSIHKGTSAEKLQPLDIKIINKRTSELMELHRKTALENKKKFLGKEIKVFVNKNLGDNLFEARDENYNIVLISSKDKGIFGKNLFVKIKTIGVHNLVGEIIK
jgi:MiaB-like tRNA modifying enzyme